MNPVLNLDDLLPAEFKLVNYMGVCEIGRPVFNGKSEAEVVAKLQLALSIGTNIKIACFYAGISTDSFYRYCKRNQDFRNRIELLREIPILLCEVQIFKAITSGDLKTIRWYAERKAPAEYSVNGAVASLLKRQKRRIDYLERLLKEKDVDFTTDTI